jgi:hypothetical protein
MSDISPKLVAEWMAGRLEHDDILHQADAAREIAGRFGAEFTYLNENGNLAINKRVLKAFRKVTGDAVIWDRRRFYWRMRTDRDAPGRATPAMPPAPHRRRSQAGQEQMPSQ